MNPKINKKIIHEESNLFLQINSQDDDEDLLIQQKGDPCAG